MSGHGNSLKLDIQYIGMIIQPVEAVGRFNVAPVGGPRVKDISRGML